MKALVQAQISAASMGYEKMGTGHLLCGLCRVGDELTRCILGDLVPSEIEEEVLAQPVILRSFITSAALISIILFLSFR